MCSVHRGRPWRGLVHAALGGLALLAVSGSWAQTSESSREAILLSRGEEAFSKGEFRIAIRDLRQFLDLVPAGPETPRADHLLGVSYYYAGQLDAARVQLRAHRVHYPNSQYLTDIDYWLGMVAVDEGEVAAAIPLLAAFRAASLESELYSYATHALAAQLELADKPSEALSLYRELIRHADAALDRSEPRLPVWLERAGRLELSMDMAAAAAARFARILDRFAGSPEAPSALFLLGEARYQSGERAAALSRFQRYATLFAEGEFLAAALYRLASSAAEDADAAQSGVGELRRVIAEMDAALLLAPPGASPPAFDVAMLRGRAAGLLGQPQEAAVYYAEADRLAAVTGNRDGQQRAVFARAEALVLAFADTEAALALFLRAADGPGGELAAYALYNAAALTAAKERTAAALLQRLLREHPTSALRDDAEAMLLQVTSDSDSALHLQVLDRIALRRQLTPEERRMQGVALVALGRERDGLQVLSQAGDRSEALYAVGVVYASRGEHVRAAGLFDQVIGDVNLAAPGGSAGSEELRWRAGFAAAVSRFNTGAYRQVVDWAGPALARMNEAAGAHWQPETRLLLAAAYSRLGDEAAAAAEYDRAADLAVRARSDTDLWRRAATGRALSLFRDGQLSAAEEAFAALAAEGVDPGNNLYRAGLSANRAGRPANGVVYLSASVDQIGRDAALHPALLYELATAQLQRGSMDAASRTVDDLEHSHPDHQLTAIAGLRRAEILAGQGALSEAERYAEAVANRANGRWPAMAEQARYLAMTLADDRDGSKSLARAWELITQHPLTSRRGEAVAVVTARLAAAGPAQVAYYYNLALAEDLPAELATVVHLAYARQVARSDPPAAQLSLQAALAGAFSSTDDPLRRQAQLLLAQLWEEGGELERALDVYGGLALDFASPLAGAAALGAARITAQRAATRQEAAEAAEALAAVAFHFSADKAIAGEAWQLAGSAAERAGNKQQAADYRMRAQLASATTPATE